LGDQCRLIEASEIDASINTSPILEPEDVNWQNCHGAIGKYPARHGHNPPLNIWGFLKRQGNWVGAPDAKDRLVSLPRLTKNAALFPVDRNNQQITAFCLDSLPRSG
jgi:hypothetical protein